MVDLPEPDGPMMATYSFRRMSSVTPLEREDPLLAHLVLARQVVNADHVRHVWASFLVLVVSAWCTRAPSLRSRIAW